MTSNLWTTIVAATHDEADDLATATIVAPLLGGCYTDARVYRFASCVRFHARATMIRASVVVAEVRAATADFRFGGTLMPRQCNFARLGATPGDAAGYTFHGIEHGVAAVFASHMLDIAGPYGRWTARWQPYWSYATDTARAEGTP